MWYPYLHWTIRSAQQSQHSAFSHPAWLQQRVDLHNTSVSHSLHDRLGHGLVAGSGATSTVCDAQPICAVGAMGIAVVDTHMVLTIKLYVSDL
ncbi:MAG: hypothetical protein DRI61_10370 [Chloroflexi bacterium]|nr:MAG: hypothetical protein DRI61_10370 [Chloroflexota bacterium]